MGVESDAMQLQVQQVQQLQVPRTLVSDGPTVHAARHARSPK